MDSVWQKQRSKMEGRLIRDQGLFERSAMRVKSGSEKNKRRFDEYHGGMIVGISRVKDSKRIIGLRSARATVDAEVTSRLRKQPDLRTVGCRSLC